MSMILKGVDMPECCGGCPCCHERYDGSCFCAAIESIEDTPCDIDNIDERLPDCPAGDVPAPHGRLIDKNLLLDIFSAKNISKTDLLAMAAEPEVLKLTLEVASLVKQFINKMPTIIEAEE